MDKLLYNQIKTRIFARKASKRKDISDNNSDDSSNDEDRNDNISDVKINSAMEETLYSQANTLVRTNKQFMDSK